MLVTGGGRGIGAAICTLAVQRGYQVAINYREDKKSALNLQDQLNELEPDSAFSVQADASDEQQILSLFAACDERFTTLDVLINNAGIVDRSIRFENIERSRIEHLLNTNVTGPLLCAREAVKRMSKHLGGSGGCIIKCRQQGRHRFLYARTGSGACQRRGASQCRSSWPDRYRDSCQRRRTQAAGAHRADGTNESRRNRHGSRECRTLASL